MTQPVLEAEGLCVGYGRLQVVTGLNLTISQGEVVALLGANGAGKTTTISGLAGILPRQGVVRWHGSPAPTSLARFARAGLALISERRSVFAGLTVEENLRLGRGDIELAFETFPELEALRRRRAGLLSGGEQQMLSLSRALSRQPTLLMVDELSLGLGPIIVSRLLAVIRKAADAGLAVLMVEQRLDLALQVADRGYVLNRGVLALEASGDDLGTRLREVGDLYMGRGPKAPADGPKAYGAD